MLVRFDRDDHVEVAEFLLAELTRHQPLGGVIHVGAHRGEEVPSYLRAGAGHVLLVEANPEHAAALEAAFSGRPEVSVLNYAAGDRESEIELMLHTSSNGGTESASILQMKGLAAIVPTMHTSGTVTVEMLPLDEILGRHGFRPDDYTLLVVDVQGAELLVLEGASAVLDAVAAVIAEVAFVDLYEGGARAEDVRDTLSARGFEERVSGYHELYRGDARFPGWGDSLFVRRAAEA
jgi:FkbM family methyltransferase